MKPVLSSFATGETVSRAFAVTVLHSHNHRPFEVQSECIRSTGCQYSKGRLPAALQRLIAYMCVSFVVFRRHRTDLWLAPMAAPKLISPHLSQSESLDDIVMEKWVGEAVQPWGVEVYEKYTTLGDRVKGARSRPLKYTTGEKRKTRSSFSFSHVSPHKMSLLRNTLNQSRLHSW